MKRQALLVIWSFPLFVATMVAGVAGLTKLGIEVAAVESAGGGSERGILAPPPVPNMPEIEWDRSEELDWDAIDETVLRIRSHLLREINDDFQESIEEEYQKLLESPELSLPERSDPQRR